MLYNAFKVLVQVSLRAYFRRIDVVGKEHLEYGNAVYVTNHPGAMIDPILIAMHAKKPFHFITGAEWFGTGLRNWVFTKQFNMIPVHRPWLAKNKKEVVNNEDMFKACYISMAAGQRIMIFPEASSQTVPWIRPLKTGAARIKIGGDRYMKEHGMDQVKIVPIGINYENPHRFQTYATLVISEPIDFSDLVNEAKDESMAILMTDRIKEAMQRCVLHVEKAEHHPVIKNVIRMMEDRVIKDLKIDPSDPASSFKAKKQIISAVEHFKDSTSEAFVKLESDLESYINDFRSEGFGRFNPFEEGQRRVIVQLLKLLLTLPIALLGFVINAIPFYIGRALFRSLLLDKVTGEDKQGEINPAFAGSLAYAVGVGVFLLWYCMIMVLAANLYTWWVAIPVAIWLGYWSGRITLFFMRWSKQIRDLIHWKRMPLEKRQDLMLRRHQILRQLQVLGFRYAKEAQEK